MKRLTTLASSDTNVVESSRPFTCDIHDPFYNVLDEIADHSKRMQPPEHQGIKRNKQLERLCSPANSDEVTSQQQASGAQFKSGFRPYTYT